MHFLFTSPLYPPQLKTAAILSPRPREVGQSKMISGHSSVCILTAVCFIFLVTILCCCVDILLFGHMEGRDEQHSVCRSKYLVKYTCGPNACHNTWSYRLYAAQHTHILCLCMCVCVCLQLNQCPVYVCVFISRVNQSQPVGVLTVSVVQQLWLEYHHKLLSRAVQSSTDVQTQ